MSVCVKKIGSSPRGNTVLSPPPTYTCNGVIRGKCVTKDKTQSWPRKMARSSSIPGWIQSPLLVGTINNSDRLPDRTSDNDAVSASDEACLFNLLHPYYLPPPLMYYITFYDYYIERL